MTLESCGLGKSLDKSKTSPLPQCLLPPNLADGVFPGGAPTHKIASNIWFYLKKKNGTVQPNSA